MGTGLAFQFFRQAAWHHGQAIGQPTCGMHLLGKVGWPGFCLPGKRNYLPVVVVTVFKFRVLLLGQVKMFCDCFFGLLWTFVNLKCS